MIGLDTNVLIRYIVQDDPKQREIANRFFATKISVEKPGYINAIVLCEMVWVLNRAYHYDKPVILSILKQILNTKELVVDQWDAARQALQYYEQGEGDFSDYYLAVINRLAGCRHTVTFDRRAAVLGDFLLLKT